MPYTKKQFLEDVAKEARALKEHATKRELNKLEFDDLDPNRFHSCIYGQMTGDCRSPRAAKLIHTCCPRYFVNDDHLIPDKPLTLGVVRKIVNGAKVEGVDTAEDFQNTRRWSIDHFSAIEAYILTPFAENKNLIDFLKGNRTDLAL